MRSTKLHGSVDWQSAGTDTSGRPVIRWGHLEKHGSHDTRGIIYPGFKGAPEKEPFKSFHDYFGEAAKHATHALFIGFAFRDFYINDLLTRSLPPSVKIAVIDPSFSLASHAFLANAAHLQMGFGPDTSPPPRSGGYIPPWLSKLQDWFK